jgi:ABC-type transporter Mla subunit MlaD
MATEPNVSTGQETEIPATEVDEPEVTTPEATGEAGIETESTEVQKLSPEQLEAELNQLKRDLKKRDRNNQRLYRELVGAKAELEARSKSEPQTTTEPTLDTVESLAERLAAVREFNKEAEKVIDAGRSKYPDFDKSTAELADIVGALRDMKTGLPTVFADVLFKAVEDKAMMIDHLANNPDVAESWFGLDVIKLAKKLDRIERDLTDSSKPKTSNAPKPLAPVKATGASIKDPANMSDKEFAAWRHAQIAARR